MENGERAHVEELGYASAMAKPKRKRKKPGGGGPSVPSTADILAELDERLAEIAATDPDACGPLWGAVHKLLIKVKADPHEMGRVVANRDVPALEGLIRALRGEEAPPVEAAAPAPTAPGADIPAETLRKAMRAFRKRLKLTRLDHESKLGVGPMTGGKKAGFDAILAPQEFPREVWDALVAEGRLRDLGAGFYQLEEDADHGPTGIPT
jgi:hypothetical protein